MKIFLEVNADSVVTRVGNIIITHKIDKKMRGDWEDIQCNINDPEYPDDNICLGGYEAELERKIRLRPASVLKAIENENLGYGAKNVEDKEVSLPGQVFTIECSGLCAALRELRENRAAARRRLPFRKKIMKNAFI